MVRIVVYHRGYGCDTGCCGHAIEVIGTQGESDEACFEFDHPRADESPRQFAERMIRRHLGDKHVADLDWDNCMIADY
jgi:hypothetical protein